jgi:hypothetical protein
MSRTVPPELASEIASILHKEVPPIDKFFKMDEIAFTAADFRQIIYAMFLLGYSKGLDDCIERNDDSPFMQWLDKSLR